MKRIELAFAALLVPFDYCLVFLASLTAYSLRYSAFRDLRPVFSTIPLSDFLLFSAVAAGIFTCCFAVAGLYEVSSPRRLKIELSRILLASLVAILALTAIIFFRGDYFTSRFIILAAWGLAVTYVSTGRIMVRLLQRALLAYRIGTHKLVVIGGDDHTTRLLTAEFVNSPAIGYEIAARFPRFDAKARAATEALRAKGAVDELFVTTPSIGRDELAALLAYAESRQLGFKYAADLVATHARNIEIGAQAGIPFVEVKGTRLDGWGRIFKRLFDIIGSLVLIVLSSPVMLLAAIAVKLNSKGPAIFRNERVGQRGRTFDTLKLRSMRADMSVGKQFGNQDAALAKEQELIKAQSIKAGPLYKIKNDPRVTSVGRFIRRYSIDELPQLFNVLFGSMSLVGPRPHQPREVEKYQDHHRRVLMIKPGITGMAQISGRSDLTFEDEIRLDTYYIENWSIWLDLTILLKTPLAVLRPRKAD